MHDVVTEEFINVGLVLFSNQGRYFRAELLTRYQRLSDTFPGFEGEFYRSYIGRMQTALDHIADRINSKQMVLLPGKDEKLNEILAETLSPDDSALRFSVVMQGAADNLDEMFSHLYDRLVERYLDRPQRVSRDDGEVWQVFRRPLQKAQVLQHLRAHTVKTPFETFEFEHAWKNGAWNVLHPLSLDLVHPANIRGKARTWVGTAQILGDVKDLHQVFILLGRPNRDNPEVTEAYRTARKLILEKAGKLGIQIVDEDAAEKFAEDIKPQVEEHTPG